MGQNMTVVGIVLLNFNNFTDTLECIRCLDRLHSVKYSIILVDNASQELVPKEIINNKKVTLIKNDFNLGFSKGVNIGANYAIDNLACNYIWFLNSDCKVHENALRSMLLIIQSAGDIGAVGSRILNPDATINCLGGGSVNLNTFRSKNILSEKHLNEIDYISGASLLCSAEIFKKLNGFDEWFFLYWEDVDFSFRIKKLGFKLKVALNSIVEHKESNTVSKFYGVKSFFGQESRVYMIVKYSTNKRILLYAITSTLVKYSITFKFRQVFYILAGFASAILKLKFNIYSLPKKYLKKYTMLLSVKLIIV